MHIYPKLFQPYVYSFFNYFKKGSAERKNHSRDLCIILLGLVIIRGIYRGTLFIINRINDIENVELVSFANPFYLIALSLISLSIMLLITNAITAVSSLTSSKDMELILAAPISKWQFFTGKLFLITISSSWMPIVFIMPFLVAFGKTYRVGISYYLLLVPLLTLYFLVLSALAIIIGLLFSLLIAKVKNFMKLTTIVLCFLITYLLLRTVSDKGIYGEQEVSKVTKLFSLADIQWLPCNWVSVLISDILKSQSILTSPELYSLLLLVFVSLCASFIAVGLLQQKAYTLSLNHRAKSFKSFNKRIIPFIPSQYYALFAKEFKLVTRELSQIAQLFVVLGIAIIYLYNIRFIGSGDFASLNVGRLSGKTVTYLMNCAIGAFITTSIGTRFVFPSVPLEGKSWWLIAKSPLKSEDLLNAKFYFWLIPVSLISSLFYGLGSYIIDGSLNTILIACFSAIALSYGIVSMGIGFGAYFGKFDWEHPAQLTAGFGSIAYMFVSVMFIFFCQVPIILIVIFSEPRMVDKIFHGFYGWHIATLAGLFLLLLSYFIKSVSFKIAKKSSCFC